MRHLVTGKKLWLLLAVVALSLAALLAGMSLAFAQTTTPLGTATAMVTASPVGTVSPLGTATAIGTVSPLATASVTSTATTTTTLRLALPQRPYLPLNLAMQAANAALVRCTQGGYTVTVTVVDRDGVQRVVLSQDGANPATPMGSYRKAFTAASFGSPTSATASRIAADPTLAGLARLDDRILALAGGVPIIANNQVVGGIGVAGAPTGTADEVCANAGVAALR